MGCKSCASKLKGLAITVGDVVVTAAKTGTIMNPLLGEQRMKVCRSCEEFKADPPQCRACGCFLSIKTPLIAAKCPREKWTS